MTILTVFIVLSVLALMFNATKIANMAVIPSNLSVKTLADGTSVLQKRRRSRRSKISAVARKARRAAAKKLKIPIIETAIVVPMVTTAMSGWRDGNSNTRKGVAVANAFLSPMAGIELESDGNKVTGGSWKLGRMWATGALVVTGIFRKFGAFRGINRSLTKARLPFKF